MAFKLLNGVAIPAEFLSVNPPDVRRHGGYHRLLHLVEGNGHAWTHFDLGLVRVSKRVAYRLRKQLEVGKRYDTIVAGRHLFIRVKAAVAPIDTGAVRAHEGVVS